MTTLKLTSETEVCYINIPPMEDKYSFPYFDLNQNLYTLQLFPRTSPSTETITFDELHSGKYTEYATWINLEPLR